MDSNVFFISHHQNTFKRNKENTWKEFQKTTSKRREDLKKYTKQVSQIAGRVSNLMQMVSYYSEVFYDDRCTCIALPSCVEILNLHVSNLKFVQIGIDIAENMAM